MSQMRGAHEAATEAYSSVGRRERLKWATKQMGVFQRFQELEFEGDEERDE